MFDLIINKLAEKFSLNSYRLALVCNHDGFLLRKDVIANLQTNGIQLYSGAALDIRVHYELNYKERTNEKFIYVVQDISSIGEDIRREGMCISFNLSDLFPDFDITVLASSSLDELNWMLQQNPINKLSTIETVQLLKSYKQDNSYQQKKISNWKEQLKKLKEADFFHPFSIMPSLAEIILNAIKEGKVKEIEAELNELNESFQIFLHDNYDAQIKNSSYVKRPQIVSRIGEYLCANYSLSQKIALFVIDGMSYWQYWMLYTSFGRCESLNIENNCIYSWLPSTTELSRQAIFRGEEPDETYVQNPANEAKLWKKFWLSKKYAEQSIDYKYGKTGEIKSSVNRLGVVNIELDEKMHASADYQDLYDLTENWIENSSLIKDVIQLAEQGFIIYLTTDHGNIEACGLGNLTPQEKLGSKMAEGSRSLRHITYANQKSADQFIDKNKKVNSLVKKYNKTVYLKDNLAFTNKEHLMTHGGTHILEVLIPFVKIRKR